ncbi:MAG TPA: TetR/AcrR family transcriptional regulator [Lachnospiraceae bacterium]|nr:TetR/AcrR family transcriptional regulator [Lachnospiraceae bacterium]
MEVSKIGQGSITKERIFQAALNTFAQQGYEGARMDKIASEVGISKASLYFYFKSKEEIFQELFEDIIQKYSAKMKMIVEKNKDMSSLERLSAIYREYLEYNWDNVEMDFWNRIYYVAPSSLKEEIISRTLESKDAFISELTQAMEEGIERGEIRSMNASHMATTFYYALTCIDLSSGLMSKEQALADMDHCFEIMWTGMKGE